jgi:hypothetical protein
MAITGQAKADYQREYMRRRREALKAGVRPGKTDTGMEALTAENTALKAELAAAKAEIWTLKTLCWGHHGLGDGRYSSMAEPLAGAYGILWVERREKNPLHADAIEGFKANFSPWGKNKRRKKTIELGNFPTHDEAMAACQAHARTIIATPV